MVKLRRSALLVARALCFIYLCWLIVRFIVAMQLTLGVILYNLTLIGIVLAALAFIQFTLNDRSLLSLPKHSGLSWRGALALVVVSLSVVTLMLFMSDRLISIPDVVLATGAVMLVSTSMVLMARGRAVDAICLYILSWPAIVYEAQDWGIFKRMYFVLSGEVFELLGLLTFVFVIVGLVSRFIHRKDLAIHSRVRAPLILLASGLITSALAPFPQRSFINYLHVILLPLLTFFFFTTSIQSWNDVKKLFVAAGVSGGLLSGAALYFVFYRYPVADAILSTIRATSGGMMSETGNWIAEIGPVTMPSALALMATATSKRDKVLWGAMAFFIFIALTLTFNRTNMVAIMIGLFPWLLAIKRRRLTTGFLVLGTLVMLLVVPQTLGNIFARFEPLTSISGIQSEGRYIIWRGALQMFLDHPLTGVGPGMWEQFNVSYGAVYYFWIHTYGRGLVGYGVSSAHGTFFQVLAEMGLVGLFAVGMILWSLIDETLYLTHSHKQNEKWLVTAIQSYALVLAYYCFLGRFPYWEIEKPEMIFCWLWFALIMAGHRFRQREYPLF